MTTLIISAYPVFIDDLYSPHANAEINIYNMYTQVWNKYLPIIKILIKRSATADQTLDMNRSDFERAGCARKSGYKFTIEFKKGRVDNVIVGFPLASNLATVLLQDETIKNLFLKNDYQVSLNTKFQLTIKCTATDLAEDVSEPAEEAHA